jgi:hypothetical protein
MSPVRKACIIGPKPLKGTCSSSVFVARLSHSMVRCVSEPLPNEPYASLPGFFCACAMSSFRLFAGTEGETRNTMSGTTSGVTASKSFAASYGSLR